MNLIPASSLKKSKPIFGSVIVTSTETVIEDFQYRLHVKQAIQNGGFNYYRYVAFYAYHQHGTAYLPCGIKLKGMHIQKIESYFPQYEGHERARSGKYLTYRICKRYQDDVLLMTEEDLEKIEKEEESFFQLNELLGR